MLFQSRKPPEPLVLEVADPDEALEVPITREEVVVVTAPRSQQAEQFRRLRNSIHALNPDGAARTVAITSAVQGEGKSLVTVNLALAMTEIAGMRVLVVDGDLERPALEEYLGLPRRLGVSDVLIGDVGIEQAIRQTSVPGLHMLAAGSVPKMASTLAGGDRIRTLMHQLKRRYDYVILDTPPALVMNDASLLGAVVDGVVLVVRLGFTPRHLVDQAYALLESVGGNVLGTCLTDASEADEGSSYRDGYRDGYREK